MIREICKQDISESYLNLLNQLSGEEQPLTARMVDSIWLDYLAGDKKTFVYEGEGEVLGTASILIEHKILHYGSHVGHIEDVVINNEKRSGGIGRKLIDVCVRYCMDRKCYKVILDCDEQNVPFYEKCGFKTSGGCMRMDLDRAI